MERQALSATRRTRNATAHYHGPLAVLALWMLARLRFPTSQVESNSVEMPSSRGANIGLDGLATQLGRLGLVGIASQSS
jgi:hypothetical protein